MMATDQMSTDVGTVVGGQQAVDYGLIDRVGSLSDALDALHQMVKDGKKAEDTDTPQETDGASPGKS